MAPSSRFPARAGRAENWICLPSQTRPAFTDGTHQGCSRIVSGSWENSGTPTARATVHHAFAPNLTAQGWELSAEVQVYDPDAPGGPGPHAYPYRDTVWAYDAADFVAVKNGKKKPWQVDPYAVWPFELPITYNDAYRQPIIGAWRLSGVAYDAKTQRIFVAQYRADGDFPLITILRLVP
jgi:hypothetical protein